MKKLYLLSTMMLLVIAAMHPHNLNAQVSVWNGSYSPWTHGTGTESDPFLIENAQQLAYLTYRVNNGLDAAGGHVSNHDLHYKLMTDVNLNGSETFQWTPIGYWISETNYYCFGGHFDGNNHTVSGLYINSSANRVGFFGYTDGAEIKNLNVSGNGVSTTGQYAGGIVGCATSTIISGSNNDCNISLSTPTSSSYAGGIVGYSSSTMTITNCYNTGNVTSSNYPYSYAGGVVGYSNSNMTVTNCYNTSNVTSPTNAYSYAGGVIGYSNSYMTITNCYNTSNVVSYCPGGIVGYSTYNSTIINCYNVGNINIYSGYSDYLGGILGYSNSSYYGNYCSVINCYYLDVCGGNNTYGGSPMSSAAMRTADFVNILNNGSCSWKQDLYPYSNVGYPTLTMIILSMNTLDANNVTQTHSTLKGMVTVENDMILSTGFMYKATNDVNYSFVTCNNITDTLTYLLTGLTPSTNYTYKAYLVTAGCDTTFGSDKTFSTSAVNVSTNYATNVTQTHSTINGSLSMGDASVTGQGFEYKRYGEGNWTQITVPYSSNISYTLSDLTPNTTYYFRAFATATECDTIYGQTRNFATFSVSSSTNNATNVTQTHATLNGSFTIGDANMSSYGFEYGKTTDTVFQTVTVSGEGSVSETVTGLTPNTQYTFRSFCTAVGCEPVYSTYYRYFTTQAVSVTTNPATNLTESSATLNGTLNMGDATITTKGFEYRAVGDTNFITVNATGGTNTFSSSLNNLPVNTFYEYRAFVEIAESTERYYGNIETFEVSWLNADTILVNDAAMLQWVSSRCNSGVTFEGKYIKLMNDITLPLNQPNNMTSIGTYPYYPFKGTFDGNGKLITNLYIDQPNTPYQGFFGYTLDANLYEVGLVNITASGRNYTGGMVAYASNTYMRNCYVSGGTLFALSYCGGLVGYQDSGTNSIISGCYNTCTVSGNNYVGGLVGFSNYSTVRNSYVAANVTGQGTGIGAIIGGANAVLMYNCFFSTTITGQNSAIGENNLRTGEGMSDNAMRDSAFVATLNQGLVVPVWKPDYANPINNGFPILIWQASENVQISGNTVVCNGANTTLTASSGASYLWSTGATGQSITVSTPGNYSVTVTKSNGNSYTASVNVTAMDPVSITGNTHICSGQSTILSASGTGNYTWSNGSHNASVVITEPGTYTVTVSQSNGCTSSASAVVTAASLPTPTIIGNTSICQGETTTLIATGGNSYAWSNGSTSTNVTVSQSGVYTVTATNVEGCSATANVTVTVNPQPNVVIVGDNNFCQGDNITLMAFGADSYSWNTGDSQSSITVTNAGTYTVTGTAANGCATIATQTVTMNPAYNIPLTHSICQGESYNFFGQNITTAGTYTHTSQTVNGCDSIITLTLTVGSLPTPSITGNTTICEGQATFLTATGGATYAWNNGNTGSSIYVAQGGIYTVTATNLEGCSATASVNLTVNPLPSITITGNTTICQGGSTTLTATGADTYSWSTGNNTATVNISAFGVYTVTGTSAAGCSNTANVTVLVSQAPQITITGETDICAGESTTLTANGGTTYLWSNGTTDATLTVSTPGTWQVIGYNEAGCNAMASATVSVWQPATSEFTIECSDPCYTWNNVEYCASGDYTQTLQTIHGCDSVVTLHLTITVGVDDYDSFDFKVYPNPTSNVVQCTMNNVQVETVEFHVFDAYGKLVAVVETRCTSSLQTAQIDLSGFTAGVYFVKAVADGNVVAVRKVVKR